MPAVSYIVTATLPDEASSQAYIDWLEAGHVDAVIKGGAHSAQIVRITEPAEPLRVQTQYVFPTMDAFRTYESAHAPALRAEGLQKFGPETGVRFERQIGTIL